MNNYTKNKDELFLYALMIGIFLFVLTAFNTNNYSDSQNSFDQKYIITELSEVAHSATLSSLPVIPDFNTSWITTDHSALKQKPTSEISVLITNSRFNTKHKLCSETYLNIKPLCFKVSTSFVYSRNKYSEAPAIA